MARRPRPDRRLTPAALPQAPPNPALQPTGGGIAILVSECSCGRRRRLSLSFGEEGRLMATEDPKALQRGFEIRSSIPVLRMLDEAKAKAAAEKAAQK